MQRVKVRERKTPHTGETPDKAAKSNLKNFMKKVKKVDNVAEEKIETKSIGFVKVPTISGVTKLAVAGVGIFAGMWTAGQLRGAAESLPIPELPLISKQTTAGLIGTAGAVTLYKLVPEKWLGGVVKETLFYASAVHGVTLAMSVINDGMSLIGAKAPEQIEKATEKISY